MEDGPMEAPPQEARERLLRLVVELELSRNRLPGSIADGEVVELLRRVAVEADTIASRREAGPWSPVVHNQLYSDVRHEALLLARLAAALKARMDHTGLPTVSGTDYFRARLDRLLERLRLGLGFNPRIPLYMYYGGGRNRGPGR